jgi:hypothetical protein
MWETSIEWAGDIDRDGLLEVILRNRRDENQMIFEKIGGVDPPRFRPIMRYNSGKVPEEEEY